LIFDVTFSIPSKDQNKPHGCMGKPHHLNQLSARRGLV
jgi:hypothetical protein